MLEFRVRTGAIGFLDSVEVCCRACGASTSIGDFSLRGSYSNTDTDQNWIAQQFNLLARGDTGRFALRYFVGDTSIDGDYVGIDSLRASGGVTGTVPTPGSPALAGPALAALGAAPRRRPARRSPPRR